MDLFQQQVQCSWTTYKASLYPEQCLDIEFALHAFAKLRRMYSTCDETSSFITQGLQQIGWTVVDVVTSDTFVYSLLSHRVPSLVPEQTIFYTQIYTCTPSTCLQDIEKLYVAKDMTTQEAYAKCAEAYGPSLESHEVHVIPKFTRMCKHFLKVSTKVV